MWNGENYLLKITRDLDYLDQYKPIRKWANFRLARNPFCVPYPLELGAHLFGATVLNPPTAANPSSSSHLSSSANIADGFFVGGGSQSLGAPQLSKKRQALVSSSVNEATNASPYRWDPLAGAFHTQDIGAMSLVPTGAIQSFVSNQDMARIRAAEQALLLEEKTAAAAAAAEDALNQSLGSMPRGMIIETKRTDPSDSKKRKVFKACVTSPDPIFLSVASQWTPAKASLSRQ
jgi:hypothetical protein